MIYSYTNPKNQNRKKRNKNIHIKARNHKRRQKQQQLFQKYFVFPTDRKRFHKKLKQKVKTKTIIKKISKENIKTETINKDKLKQPINKYGVFLDHVVGKFYFASNQRIKEDELNQHVNLFDLVKQPFGQAEEDQVSKFDFYNNLSHFSSSELISKMMAKMEPVKTYLLGLIHVLQKRRKIIKTKDMVNEVILIGRSRTKTKRTLSKYSYSNRIRPISEKIYKLQSILKKAVKSLVLAFYQRMNSLYNLEYCLKRCYYNRKKRQMLENYIGFIKFEEKKYKTRLIDNNFFAHFYFKYFFLRMLERTENVKVFSTPSKNFHSIFHLARNWFILVIRLKKKFQFCAVSFDMQKKTNQLKMNILSRSFLVVDSNTEKISLFHFKDARSFVIITRKTMKIYRYKIDVDSKFFDFDNVPFTQEIPDCMSIYTKYIENKKTLRLLTIENNQVCFFDYDICAFESKILDYKKTVCKKIMKSIECFDLKRNADSLFYHKRDSDLAYVLVHANVTDNYCFDEEASLIDSSGRLHLGDSVVMFAQFPHIYMYKYYTPSFTFLQKIRLPDLANNLKPGLFCPGLFLEKHPYVSEFTLKRFEGNKFGFMLDIGCAKYFYEYCKAKSCFVKNESTKENEVTRYHSIYYYRIKKRTFMNDYYKKETQYTFSRELLTHGSSLSKSVWELDFSISHRKY